MFSITISKELYGVQTPFYFVNRRHYREDVKLYQKTKIGVLASTAIVPLYVVIC